MHSRGHFVVDAQRTAASMCRPGAWPKFDQDSVSGEPHHTLGDGQVINSVIVEPTSHATQDRIEAIHQ